MSDGPSSFFAPLAAGAVVAGDFEVLGTLGSGGMGVVYRAMQKSTSREVALKFVRPDRAQTAHAVERMRREIVALARVNHPNAVSVISSGVEPDGSLFIAMEKVEGRSLQEVLAEEQRLSPGVAVSVLVQIASALEAAHAKEVLHRDVKPENIILQSHESGRVWAKLIDFGLAMMSDHGELTSTGVVMGSPAYMPPERWAGERNVDGRSDIYALGCVGYEMVTGHRPYRGDSAPSLLAAHCYTVPVDPEVERPELVEHRALTQILRRCLQISPDARYQTGAALVAELTTLESLYRAREAAGVDTVALPYISSADLVAWSERDLSTGEFPLRSSIGLLGAASTNPSSLEGMAMSDTVAVATDKTNAGSTPPSHPRSYRFGLVAVGVLIAGWYLWQGSTTREGVPTASPLPSASVGSPRDSVKKPVVPSVPNATVVRDVPLGAPDSGASTDASSAGSDTSTTPKTTATVVRIVTVPPDAWLSVDRDSSTKGPRVIELVPGQSVTIRAQRSGYVTASRQLSFSAFDAGQENTFTVHLRRKKTTRTDRSESKTPPREDKVDPRLRIGGEGSKR